MRQELEKAYDIPFEETVKADTVTVSPGGEYAGELFDISIRIRNGVRLICTIRPQQYAGKMLEIFVRADEEKQKLFRSYLNWFNRNADTVRVEQNSRLMSEDTWPSSWYGMEITIKKLTNPDEDINATALVWAKMAAGLMLSLLDIVPVEQENPVDPEEEGRQTVVQSTRYERSRINRQLCLREHGCHCAICGIDFENIYGPYGKGFIHVHHIEPVSHMEKPKVLDPVKDLIPVCPNCHAMLHRTNPPLLPEELKKIVDERKHNPAR